MKTTETTSNAIWEEILTGGGMWSWQLKRGTTLRITDPDGGANVGIMLYNRDFPLERLNLPDTLKALHTAHLTRGHVLFSDMGNILCSITADTVGWHDPLGGHSNAAMVAAKYGSATYQEHRNNFHRNARDNFLMELAKWGLGKRDFVANINLFSKVSVDDEGRMAFIPNHSKAGDYVELRAEMNTLVVLNTCQHPMDPADQYAPKPVELKVWPSPLPDETDYCRNFRPENQRGFILTERMFQV